MLSIEIPPPYPFAATTEAFLNQLELIYRSLLYTLRAPPFDSECIFSNILSETVYFPYEARSSVTIALESSRFLNKHRLIIK